MFFDSEPFRALDRANMKFTYSRWGYLNPIPGPTIEPSV
jgi:hypothetical protein